jgi:hypothetical protein
MKNTFWIALGIASSLAMTSSAANLDGYIRIREFAVRFGNVISQESNKYVVGVEFGGKSQRMTFFPNSKKAIINGKTVQLERATKVQSSAVLLVPPSALKLLGCGVQDESPQKIFVQCANTKYALTRYSYP